MYNRWGDHLIAWHRGSHFTHQVRVRPHYKTSALRDRGEGRGGAGGGDKREREGEEETEEGGRERGRRAG